MSLTITEYLPALPHLSKETVQTHYDELHTHLSDPKIHDQASATLIDGLEGSREKVKKEIAGLTSSLCEIRKSFDDIGVELGHFGLKDQWSEFVTDHKTFNKLVGTSRQNAANAVAVLNDFATIFPEGARIEKDDFDDLKAEVQNFIAVSVAFSSSYLWFWMIQGGFSALAEHIRSFEVTLEKAVIESTHAVSSKLQEARQKVADLHMQLTQVKSDMTHVGLACVACLSAGAISTAFLFFTLSPTAAHALVVGQIPLFVRFASHTVPPPPPYQGSLFALVPTAIEFKNKIEESKELRKQLKLESKHVADLSKEADFLKAYHDALDKTNANIEGLCTKIDNIAGIWHALESDFMILLGQLENIAGPEINYTRLVNKKVATPRRMYVELSRLLEEYVRGVDSAPVAEDAEDE
ncbi:hypothetical protein VTO73DRAFT_10425 [Trametes versicolor]